MSRCAFRIGVLLLALPAFSQSQPAKPAAGPPSMGVLIGWNPQAESVPPPDATEDAKQDPELTVSGETTLPDGSKVSHHNQTERADPLFTLWIFVSGGKVVARLLQHIIVPRRDGFWRLGINTDSAEADGSRAEEDFFWAAPLGREPKLAAIDKVGCIDQTTALEPTYVGPEYFAYSEFGTATCAHYDEGHSFGVIPLEDAASNHVEGLPPHAASLVTLLGPRAQEQYRRLSRQAVDWENECGQNGYAGSETGWTIRHRRGRWQAAVKFVGSGGGICGRYDQDVVLDVPLPRSLVTSNAPLPVPWRTVERAFPQAQDAAASPDGKLIIVFGRGQVLVAALEDGQLRMLSAAIAISPGNPVLIEWAVGANATRWGQVLTTLPPPNPKAIPHAPVP